MDQQLLLGDEAVAQGAIDGGLKAAYSYPGTPASEIMEYLIKAKGAGQPIKASWTVNEKVAYEEALGASFAGQRSMVSMKHVGLNVAADPFMNSALVEINGGLIVVVADDPGMHSSQNEQDSRYYADFAHIFCLEPSHHQEAYDMARQAFEISEKFHIPVMLRLVTHLSHSRSVIKTSAPATAKPLPYAKNSDWTLLPVNARRLFNSLLERGKDLKAASDTSPFNSLTLNKKNRSLGIIASGIGYNYVRENLKDSKNTPSLLKISTYPLPETLIKELLAQTDKILIVEEGYPFIEKTINGLFGVNGKKIYGKLTGDLPPTGELSPDIVGKALGINPSPAQARPAKKIAGRPPQLCQGCPHTDSFTALNKVLENFPQAVVFSDIGCYTLSALPPLSAVDTCVCMGASVSMAKGAADIGVYPSIGTIGDSTFAHSGITPLLDAARNNTNMTLIILDNATVAMTGGQPTFATGQSLIDLIIGLGIDRQHVRTIVPLAKNLAANIDILRQEIEFPGLSVIISQRECIQEAKKKAAKRGEG